MNCLLAIYHFDFRYFVKMLFLSSCWNYTYWLLRPLFKWFLRKTTRLCELQRICYGEPAGAKRALGVEFSLTHSRSNIIQETCKLLDENCRKKKFLKDHHQLIDIAVQRVMIEKQINPHIHAPFVKSFGAAVNQVQYYLPLLASIVSILKQFIFHRKLLQNVCVPCQIWGYREMYHVIEDLRLTAYDSSNAYHEENLLTLWKLLMPSTPLECRVTKQWQDIGFQGMHVSFFEKRIKKAIKNCEL